MVLKLSQAKYIYIIIYYIRTVINSSASTKISRILQVKFDSEWSDDFS